MEMVEGTYDLSLVGLSILAAILAAFISIDLIDMYLNAESRSERRKWRIFSAISLGLGIWIMHFIGMFAYKVPMTIHYDGVITIVSLLIAIIACLVGVKYVRKSTRHILTYGAVFMGGGIASMHYLGIYAMHMSASHIYDPVLVVASILVGIVVSGSGLLIIRHLCRNGLTGSIPLKLSAACVLGVAISGMHYLGMAAMTHVMTDQQSHSTEDYLFIINSDFLMAELVIGGMVLLLFSFYTVASERCLLNALTNEKRLLKSSENRLSTLLENIADAVAVINERGTIELFNKSAEQMFSYERDEVLGKNISILMAGIDHEHHDEYIQNYMETGASRIMDVGTRQLTAVNKQGNEILIGLSINKVSTENGLQFIGVMRDMTEHRRELDKLTERADHDSLTGLANRHKLFIQLEHAIALAKRNSTSVCLMFLDLDGFKAVNDEHGHDAGDELLRQVAVLLREKTRESDIISRFGGDEFCLLFEGISGCDGMRKLAEKIVACFQSPFHVSDNAVEITASIGVAFYPDDSDDDGDLIKHADHAMYEAKKAGKNQYKFYENQCCENS